MNHFRDFLYNWYKHNKRDLPWRETNDPYKIWISEIILQQTRVHQGLDYYLNFITAFPDVESLAGAHEDEVLKLWQGLGYYSRARNLHHAAKRIVSVFSGKFPGDYHDVIRLKGIGPYTAAAVLSIAFNMPFPVLDGNVYRFLSRYFCIDKPIDSANGKKYFRILAETILDESNPGQFNQALMEFGALYCVPQNPDCANCIFSATCLSLKNKMVMKLPVKAKKKLPETRFFNYFLFDKGQSVFLQRRIHRDIWHNLFQLPLIETKTNLKAEELLSSEGFKNLVMNFSVTLLNISRLYKHNLTHQVIMARFYHFQVNNDFYLSTDYLEILKKDIPKFAVPKLIEIYFENEEI